METTPYYFYDLDLLQETLDTIQLHTEGRNFHVHYAIKANNNHKILEMIAKRGFGADCVSGWEIESAIDAGFAPSSVVFAGVGMWLLLEALVKFAESNRIYALVFIVLSTLNFLADFRFKIAQWYESKY